MQVAPSRPRQAERFGTCRRARAPLARNRRRLEAARCDNKTTSVRARACGATPQAEHTAWVQERRAQREARAAERAARELALADAVSRPGSRHLCADDAPAPGTPPYAASLGALSARSAVSRVASAASQRASPNEGLAAHDDDDDGEELEEELADGSVEVHVGDFPAPAQWRALVPAAAVLQLNDEQTSGVNPSLITQRVEQLFHVEGRFKPEDKDDDTQLVLEVRPHALRT